MFITAESIPKGSEIESDICVIGAGAAGIGLALEFEGSKKKVLVLESGNLEPQEQIQELNRIENVHLPVAFNSRIRSFGGTTTVWMGLWKPHDPIDFEKREWVGGSGWPISFDSLRSYYHQAAIKFDAPSGPDSSTIGSGQPFLHEDLQPTVLGRVKKDSWDFGKRFRLIFGSSKNIDVCLNASAAQLIGNKQDTLVDHVLCKTLGGNEFRVRAKTFILATGGIENARLLLLSNLGNNHDQVGRYFMEHPKGAAGKIVLNHAVRWPYDAAGVAFTPLAQKKYQVLNSYVLFEPRNVPLWSKFQKKLLGVPLAAKEMILRNFMEQAPDSDNRVYLSDARDALGLRLPKIDWQIGELDRRTMIVLHKLINQQLQAVNAGELQSPLLQGFSDSWPITKDASHHMGTTRMGRDPKNSVVDENCRVHGVANVYVAGSSVFPTSGYANPTATILALTLRLADHLKTIK